LGVNELGSWPGLTTCHEIGHLLDYFAFGNGRHSGFATDALWHPVRMAINASKSIAAIEKMPAKKRAYFLDPAEQWARAYGHYIAEKSKDPTLLADLPRVRSSRQPWRHWDTNDFAPSHALGQVEF
jgi:hypothetical protein